MKEDIKKLQEENAFLRNEVVRLKDELIRFVSHNLDLSERLEYDVELRRRTEAAREIMEARVERQQNADLQDDGQLMALIEILVEKDRPHLRPDFGPTDLADMLGVSMTRLYQLFRHQTIHRTPEAYIDNLRTLAALRLSPAIFESFHATTSMPLTIFSKRNVGWCFASSFLFRTFAA